MNGILKLFVLFCGLVSAGAVFYLLGKRKISERNSLPWLAGAFAILLLSTVPGLLEVITDKLGIDYPPALLFLVSILILLLIILHHSIQISLLNERLKELTQQMAIYQAKEQRANNEQKIER